MALEDAGEMRGREGCGRMRLQGGMGVSSMMRAEGAGRFLGLSFIGDVGVEWDGIGWDGIG